jgi:hypothetical protein
MYLVGHVWMTELAGNFREEDIYDDGLLMLMLPDYAECHNWAFSEAWVARDNDMRLVQAHMLADWYVHFGDTWSADKKKIGWAYRSMRPASQVYKEFFGRATAIGLRDPERQQDSVRGFSHTMLEYAIDVHIARQGRVDDRFERMRTTLGQLEDAAHVEREIARLGVYPDHPQTPASAFAANYLERARLARDPMEIAAYAGARKFGLRMCRESVDYVSAHLDRLLAVLDPKDLDDLTAAVARAIADPATFHYVDANFDLTTPPEEL